MINGLFIAIITTLLIASCAADTALPQRYFDYSGADGCSPANIGHRLGGDIETLPANSTQAMRAIESRQDSDCFKNWEFDLNQAKDRVVLFHDSFYQGKPLTEFYARELPLGTLDTTQFSIEFSKLVVVKPVIIDIKNLPDPASWKVAKELAQSIKLKHGVGVWFITSKQQAERMQGICPLINGEFDIMLYRRGGALCQ